MSKVCIFITVQATIKFAHVITNPFMSVDQTSRRKFLADGARLLAAAGAASIIPGPLALPAQNRLLSANEKIVVGLIGANNMGFADLRQMLRQPNVACAAICDIDDAVLNAKVAETAKLQGKAPARYKDFRKLIDNKDIDAVIIGTPDHWHCLPAVYACEAGKDVYVEKPLANSIAECELMVKAARKYNRVVQVGQQQRSAAHFMKVTDMVRTGQIGQLRKVHIWANFSYGIGRPEVPDTAAPAGVDFDTWLGPAPARSFNPARFHGSWRMFWDYGGGLMTDWGVHLIDMALWAKDITQPPLSVTASGGNWAFPDHAHETFDTMSVCYQLRDFTITWEHTAGIQTGPYNRTYGIAFIGNDATIVVDRSGWELMPETANGQYKMPAVPKQDATDSHEDHIKNFLDCIKTRKNPNCTIEQGRLVAMYAHIGNIALRTQSRLEWNQAAGNFGDNRAANALITPRYRRPWTLPVV